MNFQPSIEQLRESPYWKMQNCPDDIEFCSNQLWTRNSKDMSSKFTPRENQVLELILEEKSSSSIAQELGISERTVETYRRSIYSKTGVKTVVGLVKHVLNAKKN